MSHIGANGHVPCMGHMSENEIYMYAWPLVHVSYRVRGNQCVPYTYDGPVLHATLYAFDYVHVPIGAMCMLHIYNVVPCAASAKLLAYEGSMYSMLM